jgi:hypothetical protein
MNATWIREVLLFFLLVSVGRIDASAQHVGFFRGSVERSRAEDTNFQQSAGLDIDATNSSIDDLQLVGASFWPDCYQSCQDEVALCGWLCLGQRHMWHPDVKLSVQQMNDSISSQHLKVEFLSHCWTDYRGFVCVGDSSNLTGDAGRRLQPDDNTSTVAIDVTNSSDDDLHLVTAEFWPDCYQSCGASNKSSTIQTAKEELKPTLCGYTCIGKTNVSHPDVNFTVHQSFDKNWSTQAKRLEINFRDHCWWGWRGYVCV